jgi:hypothetical protein
MTRRTAGWLAALVLWAGAHPAQAADYTGTVPGLSVRFRHPDDWRLSTERGAIDTYQAIRLHGPWNRGGTYAAVITIRSVEDGAAEPADAAVERWLAVLPEGASIEAQTVRQVAGLPAQDVTVAYTVPPLHVHGHAPVDIPVKLRLVVLQRPPHRYELTFSADAREYLAYTQLFEQLVASFAFQ